MEGQVPGIGRIVHVWIPEAMRWKPAIVVHVANAEQPNPNRSIDVVVFGIGHVIEGGAASFLMELVPEQRTEPPPALPCWRWPPRS